MERLVYINDRFLKEENAVVSYLDLGLQRGYAIFDFFRLIGNQPLHLEDHLDRFYASAEQMRLTFPKSRDEMKHVIKELIWENDIPNSGIRIQLTGGIDDGHGEFHSPLLIVSQHQFPFPSAEWMENGMTLALFNHQRQLPQVKSTDYLMSIWLQPLLKQSGADDILYFSNGLITESPRSNFFLVGRDRTLVTPSNNILKGVTRKNLIQLASTEYAIEERDMLVEELSTAAEAFITSTTKQIIPVVQVDRRPIGDGRPGEITRKLMQQLRERTGIK